MHSKIHSCEAIVLRNLRFGETSRIVTLLSRELGKFGAMAKGGRDPKSGFGASLELFQRSGFIVYYRPGRDLQLLKSAWVEQEFHGCERDWRRYVYGSALLEFLDRVLLEEEPQPELYRLALRGLEVMDAEPIDRLREFFRAFQLRAAACLGYHPALVQCLRCGRRLEDAAEDDAWLFRTAEGGVLCPDCGQHESGIRLRPRAIRRVHAMASGSGGQDRSPDRLEVRERPASNGSPEGAPSASSRWLVTLDRLVEEYLRFHLERYRGLRSLDWWGEQREARGA